ncbi:MAG: hypothetical protein JXQ29_04815 [Planctomycetes bacterium]|nr:hypothetical protein [Planctomycetota bacterium]
MAYDVVRRRVILFSGATAGSVPPNDTWEWDGNAWTQLGPAVSPPARYSHAMAYDGARQRVVLFGGYDGGYFGDTWEWDGANWTRQLPALSPPARARHAMAYDAARRRVVLFGGSRDNWTLNDTWEWDGSTWTQAYPGSSPLARHLHAMTFDAARQRMVMFGGYLGSSVVTPSETWEYAGTALVASGVARRGGTVKLALTALSDAGRSYQVASSLGTGPTAIGYRQLGLSPDGLFVLTVSDRLPAVFQGYRGVIEPGGRAAASIAIPAASALIGLTIHSAFVTLDPAAPDGIQAISTTESFQISG